MADDSVWVARLVAAARSGTQLDLAGEGSANPTEADEWDPGRTIPAAAVRAALLTKGLDPDPRGLRIRGANIIGALDLEHATLPCTLTITDSRFNEPVLMEGLACRQLVLTGSHTPGLDLDQATITGGVFLTGGFTATGEVRALGANIGGQLSLRGATLTNPDGDALNLNRATITSGMFLDEGFTATGAVRALGANISGQLSLRGATLTNPDGYALSLDGATITGDVFLDGGFTATGQVTMKFATLNVLVGSDKPPGQLVVTGWRLGDIHGGLNDPKTMTSWLDAVPAEEFALQPWHEAAAVYDRQGRPTDAKRLRVAAARRVTARSKLPSKLLRTLYGWFAGYGYYPLLAGVWLIAAAIMAGTLTFFFGATQASTSGASLDPGLYGAAVVIPPAAGIIPSSWTVTSPLWLAWTLIALKAFGWLQTAILIAGLTGLLKKN